MLFAHYDKRYRSRTVKLWPEYFFINTQFSYHNCKAWTKARVYSLTRLFDRSQVYIRSLQLSMQDTSRLIYSGGMYLPSLWNWLVSGSKFLFHQFLNLYLYVWMVSELPRKIVFHNPRNFWPLQWFVVLCFLGGNPHKESVCLFSFTFHPVQSSSLLHQVIHGSLLAWKEKVKKEALSQSLNSWCCIFPVCISLTFQLDCFIFVHKKMNSFHISVELMEVQSNLPCELLWSQVWAYSTCVFPTPDLGRLLGNLSETEPASCSSLSSKKCGQK